MFRSFALPFALLFVAASGCIMSAAPAHLAEAGNHTTVELDPAPKAIAAKESAAAANAAIKGPDQKALNEILSQVQELGELDPATQKQLLEDLQKTDPALWPQLVQVFRASLAYRKQHLEQAVKKSESSTETANSYEKPPRPPAMQTAGLSKPAKPSEVDPESSETEISLSPSIAIREPKSPRIPTPEVALSKTKTDKHDKPNGSLEDHSAPTERVKPVTHQAAVEPLNREWRQEAADAAAALENELRATESTGNVDVQKQASLRMLYLLSGRKDEAARPIPGLSPQLQDFWSKEMYGLAAYLDTERTPDSSRRAGEAVWHLREAAQRLGELAPLQVRNLNLCKNVDGFGMVKKFDRYEFKPNEPLLLYAEVENFQSNSSDKGQHTALKAGYQILDSAGQKVAEQEFAVTEEFCQNTRRDFYVCYHAAVPQRINPGRYTLNLTIEDVGSRKIGQSSLEFSVIEFSSK